MKIAFYSPQIDVRGTCVALYDYAHFNETLLGNISVIVIPKGVNHDEIALVKFMRRFRVIIYTDLEDLEQKISDCDVLYCIKYGKNDGIISRNIKTVIHCVFDMSEPHGDVYAAVSSTLAKKFNRSEYVPHMISLRPSINQEDNMRKILNIPSSAIVFGRHGGEDTFDLDMAKNAIIRIVNDYDNRYFIFVNTPIFYEHSNIIYLNKICDLGEKNRFISSCDAMIHAQSLGETFGISIGEFSINNKPIITYGGPVWNDNYRHILMNRAIYYDTEENCYEALSTFNPAEWACRNNNCYSDYKPKRVMEIFKNVFLI